MTRRAILSAPVLSLALLATGPLSAGFSGTDVFIAGVARAAGQNNSQFYTTLWLTNTGSFPVNAVLSLYETGKSNTAPVTFPVSVLGNQTLRLDDVVGTWFNQPGKSGSVRISSTGELLASSRTYNLPASGKLDESSGLFFGAVPASFAIGLSESTELQGVSQNATENFRYNVGAVETGGQAVTVRFQAFSDTGALLGTLNADIPAFGRVQYTAAEIAPSITSSNARIRATVTAGTGKVIAFGTQIANASNDSSGFEMSFKSSLLGGAAAGVTTLNGLSGTLTLAAGPNITITPLGSTITIGAAGSQGGFALPFTGSLSSNSAGISVQNDVGTSIHGINLGINPGVYGQSTSTGSSAVGVLGRTVSSTGFGVYGHAVEASGPGNGVYGISGSPDGTGVKGESQVGGVGVGGFSTSTTTQGVGVFGYTQGPDDSYGVSGDAIGSARVYGVSGRTTSGHSGAAGVQGLATVAAANAGRFQNSAANVTMFLGTQVAGTSYEVYGSDAIRGGSLQITGAKMFVTPHPEDPTKEIDYIAVEGPTADVYFRGTARLVNGVARVAVPDHFRLVAREGSYMTTLTPVGKAALLMVESEDASGIVVRGGTDVTFHYVVYAERDALAGHQAVAPNVNFLPETLERTGGVAKLPEAMRAALVKNGTLNPDGTWNEKKLEALGWAIPAAAAAR